MDVGETVPLCFGELGDQEPLRRFWWAQHTHTATNIVTTAHFGEEGGREGRERGKKGRGMEMKGGKEERNGER